MPSKTDESTYCVLVLFRIVIFMLIVVILSYSQIFNCVWFSWHNIHSVIILSALCRYANKLQLVYNCGGEKTVRNWQLCDREIIFFLCFSMYFVIFSFTSIFWFHFMGTRTTNFIQKKPSINCLFFIHSCKKYREKNIEKLLAINLFHVIYLMCYSIFF